MLLTTANCCTLSRVLFLALSFSRNFPERKRGGASERVTRQAGWAREGGGGIKQLQRYGERFDDEAQGCQQGAREVLQTHRVRTPWPVLSMVPAFFSCFCYTPYLGPVYYCSPLAGLRGFARLYKSPTSHWFTRHLTQVYYSEVTHPLGTIFRRWFSGQRGKRKNAYIRM